MPQSKAFKELLKNVEETYLGKRVKKKYQKRYGQFYDRDEIKSLTFAIARSRGIPERRTK